MGIETASDLIEEAPITNWWEPFRDYFAEQGCRIDIDEEYRDRYSVDFAITRARGIHSAVNLGIHVTSQTDNFQNQEVFVEAARRSVVSKGVYIELCTASLDTGVIPVCFAACISFLFDRRYQHAKAIGVRVFEDCTFHHFDLEENVRRLRKDMHDAAHDEAELLDGEIIAYFADKGFGFIEENETQKFFFHIANVVDEQLRLELPGYVQGDTIPVRFVYGGSEGKKYPKAIEVSAVRD